MEERVILFTAVWVAVRAQRRPQGDRLNGRFAVAAAARAHRTCDLFPPSTPDVVHIQRKHVDAI